MIPVYRKDGSFAKHNIRVRKMYLENGYIVTEYIVLVPDLTISGDHRHELARTRVKVEP